MANTDSTTDGAAAMTLTGDAGYIGFAYSLHDSYYGIPGHEHHKDTFPTPGRSLRLGLRCDFQRPGGACLYRGIGRE